MHFPSSSERPSGRRALGSLGLGGALAALLLALTAFARPAAAQVETGTVRGVVINEITQQPLAGAQIFVLGTKIGTLTNSSGAYLLVNVPAGQQTVKAQIIGFGAEDQVVSVQGGQTATANFGLRQSAIALDEVVVTGAGVATERRKLGNTVATIGAEALENKPISTFSEALQGREPGVVGIPGGGLTGEGAQIRIRGSSSLSQSNEPIVYVDGIRVDNSGGFTGVSAGGGGSPSRLDDINPESIERVEILKGAAAATLYGTEASNGVIQIFTKKGSAGAPRWTFSTEQGFLNYPEDRYKLNAGFARTPEQAATVNEVFGTNVQPFEVFERPIVADLFETGYTSQYSGSVMGGSESVQYFLSGRYQFEDGPFGGEDLGPARDENNRMQFTGNVTLFPTDNLRLRFSSFYTESEQSTIQNNNNIFGVLSLAMFGKPELAKCFNAVAAPGRCEGPGNPTGQAAFATVREAMQNGVTQDAEHFNGAINANYQLTDNAGIDATIGVDVTNARSAEAFPFGWNVDEFSPFYTTGYRGIGDRNHREFTMDLKGNWDANLSTFSSSLVLGTQAFLKETSSSGGYGYEFPGPGLEVAGAAADQEIFEELLQTASVGVFVQEQIGYNDFVFLTLGTRYDKHSAFGENTEGALYPKASISIVPTSMANWNSDLISTARLRAAVGRSGLQPGAFDKFTTFSPLASDLGPGLQPDNLGNPDLAPEVSTEWEVGAEVGLFRDRVAVEATYWDRTTEDALIARQFPVTGGFRATQLDNIGQLDARGWELGIKGAVAQTRNFTIDAFANAAYLDEMVTDLGGAPPLKVGGSYPRYRNFIKEGFAPGALFGAKLLPVGAGQVPFDTNRDGIPDTEAELRAFLASPQKLNDARLNPLIADEDGDGDLLDHYLGKPTADWSGAFGADVSFLRNFEFSTMFEWKAGFQVTNLTDAFRQSNAVIGRNIRQAAEVESIIENPASTAEQRAAAALIWANELKALAPFSGLNTVEDGDFVRWREASLTYSVPNATVQRFGVGLESLAISLTGRNLALWTDYSGIDPELNFVGRCATSGLSASGQLGCNFGQSIDAFGFPLPRRFSLSVSTSF